jgi:hypothetical protein
MTQPPRRLVFAFSQRPSKPCIFTHKEPSLHELDDLDLLARADRLRLHERAGDFTLVRRGLIDAQAHLDQPVAALLVAADLEALALAVSRLYSTGWSVNPADETRSALALRVRFDDHPAYVFAYLCALAAHSAHTPLDTLADSLALNEAWLHSLLPATPHLQNPAKQLALRLFSHTPLLWAESPWLVNIAQDWRLRILRYAESAALVADLSDMLQGWSMARFPTFWPNTICIARLASAAPAYDARIFALQSILRKRRFDSIEIAPPAGSAPAMALHLLYWGEWVALYLAALYGVDPADRVPLQLLGMAE